MFDDYWSDASSKLMSCTCQGNESCSSCHDGRHVCESCGEEDCDCEPFDWREADDDDRSDFVDPGGNSSLRAATPDNPRDQPCPTCGEEDVLTRRDVAIGYQCNRCADREEYGGW